MSKTILITGATDGIGLATAQSLAAQGHNLLIHGRNPDKLAAAAEAVSTAGQGAPVSTFLADLSNLGEVAAVAAAIEQGQSRIDVLINNAGIFKTNRRLTADGQDVRFVVNTLAPALLTQRLLPLIPPEGRVVNLSSAAQAPVDLEALAGRVHIERDFDAYAQSKLALTMWSQSLGQSLAGSGPMIVAVNPASMLASKMVKEGFGVAGNDLSIGVDILCRAALSAEFEHAGGRYYDNDAARFADPHPQAADPQRVAAVVAAIEALLP